MREPHPHQAIADQLILSILGNASFDGLGEQAIIQSAKDCAIDVHLARVLFPSVPNDIIIYAHDYGDRKMVEFIKHSELTGVRAIIHGGIMFRYQYFAPYRAAIKSASIHLANPLQSPLGLDLTARTADALWICAGDASHDFNYYTKRGLLIGVLLTALPVYLSDNSPELSETDEFVRNRLNDVVEFGKFLGKAPPLNPPEFFKNFWKQGAMRLRTRHHV